MARKRFKSFSRAAIEGHLKASHGRCPPELTAHFIDLLAAREWTYPVTIGEAFGLVSHAHVRHAMTDYDRLLRIPGLTREEALLITRPEVLAIVASWATPPGVGVSETGGSEPECSRCTDAGVHSCKPRYATAFALMRDTQRDTALLEAAERVRVAPTVKRSLRLGLIAAGVVLVAGLSAVVLVRPYLAEKPLELATPLGQRAEHPLSDKSVVTLAADSGVSVRYGRDARDITLAKGDAVFNVAKDAKRPFRVQAGDTQVTAVGTVFEVERVSDAVQVRVFEGVVRVSRNGAEQRLTQGQWLMLASNRAPVTGRLDTGSYEAWRSDWLDADGLPLKYVVARLNRYTTQQVALRDPALGELKVTGRIKLDRPTEPLAMLGALLEMQPRADGGRI